jgi:sugar/nucleoside kinase (ribokinase family)
MASYLIEDKNLFDASVFANKAASISVTRKGASSSMPTKEEVVNLG